MFDAFFPSSILRLSRIRFFYGARCARTAFATAASPSSRPSAVAFAAAFAHGASSNGSLLGLTNTFAAAVACQRRFLNSPPRQQLLAFSASCCALLRSPASLLPPRRSFRPPQPHFLPPPRQPAPLRRRLRLLRPSPLPALPFLPLSPGHPPSLSPRRPALAAASCASFYCASFGFCRRGGLGSRFFSLLLLLLRFFRRFTAPAASPYSETVSAGFHQRRFFRFTTPLPNTTIYAALFSGARRALACHIAQRFVQPHPDQAGITASINVRHHLLTLDIIKPSGFKSTLQSRPSAA